jgi:hypothetical protein
MSLIFASIFAEQQRTAAIKKGAVGDGRCVEKRLTTTDDYAHEKGSNAF